MKLHKDGTVEGTPQEIAEYNSLLKIRGVIDTGWTKEIMKRQGESNPLMPRDTHKPVITSGGCIQSAGTGITAWNKMTSDIMQMQEEYWKNRKPEDRPTVMFGMALDSQ